MGQQHTGSMEPMRLEVPAEMVAVPTARRAVRLALAERVPERVLADAELVVSELVTNSVRHGAGRPGASVRVGVALGDGVLRLEVDDEGTGSMPAIRPRSGEDTGGYGLQLVDLLSRRWGVRRADRTRVWAEISSVPETA